MNKHLSSKEDCVYNTMNMNRMWNENDGSVGENVIYLVAMSMLFLIYFLGFYMYIPDLAVKLFVKLCAQCNSCVLQSLLSTLC